MTLSLFHLLQTSLLLSTTVAFIITTIPDPVVHFGVGAIAGGCGAIAYQPFDYIKAQIQSDRGGQRYQQNGWNCFIETCQNDPRRLFQGMTASVTGVAPEKSVKLGVNDVLRDICLGQLSAFPLWAQILSGATAGACQVLVSSPLDVIKVRMQTRGSSSERQSVFKEEDEEQPEEPSFGELLQEVGGPRGLYRGAEACLLRDVSFTAVCFPLYSALMDAGLNAFVAGALSGMLSTFIATPSDMVKTRILTASFVPEPVTVPVLQPEVQLQAQPNGAAVLTMTAVVGGGSNSTALFGGVVVSNQQKDQLLVETANSQDNNNPFRVAKEIVEKEGLPVLFTGAYERVVGAIPRFGITLGAHEWLEHYAHSVGLLS